MTLVLLALTACSNDDTYVCGACLGSSYSLTGIPADVTAATVTVCVADLQCTPVPDPDRINSLGSQSLPLPDYVRQHALVGETIRVVFETGSATWSGEATLSWHSKEGPCDCSGLRGVVQMANTR
ncbi:hypothetical protein [Nocardioides panacihumi]|uniref:hypothetical protein n=1 Tax=Nocardioides panacihumi TaxID=400774 RepID=UPI0031D7134D